MTNTVQHSPQYILNCISSIPYIDKRIISGKRYQSIYYTYLGSEFATVNKTYTRGKETDRSIHITQAGESYFNEHYNNH